MLTDMYNNGPKKALDRSSNIYCNPKDYKMTLCEQSVYQLSLPYSKIEKTNLFFQRQAAIYYDVYKIFYQVWWFLNDL